MRSDLGYSVSNVNVDIWYLGGTSKLNKSQYKLGTYSRLSNKRMVWNKHIGWKIESK